MLKFYNDLTHKLEDFEPINPEEVKIYNCGPTVYNYVHIGNLRAYLFVDLLKRYLQYSDYDVTSVMNVTDVDDKTIRDSIAAEKSLKEFTDFYLEACLRDMQSMNILPPTIIPRATEHIDDMVSLIQSLMDKGFAYELNGSIYYRLNKFESYGAMAEIDRTQLRKDADGRQIKDEYGKDDAQDFVLWKAWDAADGEVFWETPLGKGRPGWHIECSAMSMKYLGETFDIHTGGVDLIFPHHTNEIAQSEAATGEKFVNYWLHNNHVVVDGQKMAKSAGNFYTLRDIVERGFHPLLLRLVFLHTHYRQKVNFTFEILESEKEVAQKFVEFLLSLSEISGETENSLSVSEWIDSARTDFRQALDDDLNVSNAFAALYDFMNKVNRSIKQINEAQATLIREFMVEVDQVLGFITDLYQVYEEKLQRLLADLDIQDLISKRQELKANKDYAGADAVREELRARGLMINDTPRGYSARLVKFL